MPIPTKPTEIGAYAPKNAPRPSAHPVAVGETVTVLALTPTRSPFIEGRAVVEGTGSAPNHYWVIFLGERAAKLRAVHPDYQRDPERAIAILRDLWRADPVIDDFSLDEKD